MIDCCTFTGIDEKTDLSRVADISAAWPLSEFGILLSRTPEDKDARYPAFSFIEDAAARLGGKTRLALHVCGRAVGEFVARAPDLWDLAAAFGRVQLNFRIDAAPFSVEELDAAIQAFHGKVITQHFPANAALAGTLLSSNHQVLYDASGGRGVAAEGFMPPFARKKTGYAGGMGPETVVSDIARVHAAVGAGGPDVWIDMESRIRTDGYLDLEKCETVAVALAAGAVA